MKATVTEDPEPLLQEMFRRWQRDRRRHERRFPADPPNAKSRHAVLLGILCDNGRGPVFDVSRGPRVGEYRRVFTYGPENIYVWTHMTNEYSLLISHLHSVPPSSTIWRTAGAALRIAYALTKRLEHDIEPEYAWVYYFSPSKAWNDLHFLEPETTWHGAIESLRYWADAAPILELLQRDERFYVAAQNTVSSAKLHSFCLTCALSRQEAVPHPNHEPPAWALVAQLPDMEAAVVQATRAVEAILGKPGSRDTPQKVARAVDRWKAVLDLEPFDDFYVGKQPYFHYYYEMFELRNASAHSLGVLPASFRRQLAIRAQTFAWLIVLSYFRRRSIARDAAMKSLRFNRTLLGSISEDFSTPRTASEFVRQT
jgi:hypothetical protein